MTSINIFFMTFFTNLILVHCVYSGYLVVLRMVASSSHVSLTLIPNLLVRAISGFSSAGRENFLKNPDYVLTKVYDV